jgi:hypothetical protein
VVVAGDEVVEVVPDEVAALAIAAPPPARAAVTPTVIGTFLINPTSFLRSVVHTIRSQRRISV